MDFFLKTILYVFVISLVKYCWICNFMKSLFFFVSIMFYCILCCKKTLCISVDMVFILSSLQTSRSTVHIFCTKQTTTVCLLSVCSTGHFLFHDFTVFMLAIYFILSEPLDFRPPFLHLLIYILFLSDSFNNAESML